MSAHRTVDEWRGIRVGDRVEIAKEDGFHAGHYFPCGMVVAITVVTWTPEESARLHVPDEEGVFVLSNGSTAGTYDRIRKVE